MTDGIKKNIQASCVTALLLFLLLVAFKEQLLVPEDYQGAVFLDYQAESLFQYMAFAVGICILILCRGKIKNSHRNKVAAFLTLAIMPTVSFWMFETIAGNFETIISGNVQMIRMNLYIWYLLYAVVFAVTNSARITILLLNGFTYILAVANAFVTNFRLQPIMPMDLKSITTAASVAGEYDYTFSVQMIVMGLLFVFITLWIVKADFKWHSYKSRLLYTFLVIGCTWYVLNGMLVGDWFEKAGSTGLDFFRFDLTYAQEGYMACTVKSIRFLSIEEPEEYSIEKVKAIAENVENEGKVETELPENVIVVMNESFADLSVLGKFQTSEPVLSYFNSLSGDHVRRGNLYVSAFGGGTANTEFEFLTGNSLAYLPFGSVAYQMYVDKGDSSIVSCFKENGYRTIAFHPNRKENYNRPDVYSIYGFDEYYARDDVEIKKMRKFASDKSDYENLIKMYEEKPPGERLFIFNVTMQNHGGYDYKKFKTPVTLSDYPGQFPQAEQYLGLMKKSDEALKYLLDYFSQVDEKTVILLFGDHQPRLEDGFSELLLASDTTGNPLLDLQKQYVTPYLLWANYPLTIEAEENISANYMGSYLLKAIGMDLPVYNQYLLDLQKKIPAINLDGFLDNNNEIHLNSEAGEYTELLNEYRLFQYNNLFDNKNRLTELYE